MSHSPYSQFATRLKRWRKGAICIFTASLLVWALSQWLVSAARSTVAQRLARHGLRLDHSDVSWSPWAGITFNNAALHHMVPGSQPAPPVSISKIHVDLLWNETWRLRSPVTRWQAQNATITVADSEGKVSLEQFTTDFIVREGQVNVASFHAAHGPLIFDLAGQIFTASSTETQHTDQPFVFNIRPLRAVIEALNFKPGSGPFTLSGTLSLDLRPSPNVWTATLRGSGSRLEWRGLPMPRAELEAALSQNGLQLSSHLALDKGSADIDLARSGWNAAPLTLSGTLADAAGRTDEFKGRHQGDTGTLTIDSLSGSADLLELLRNLPALAAQIPDNVRVKTFPPIVARDFVWHFGTSPSEWSLASLLAKEPATIVVILRGQPLTIDHLTGTLSRKENKWHFDDLKASLLGGEFAIEGTYDGRMLSSAGIRLQSLRLSALAPWTGSPKGRLGGSDLSLTYKGSICAEDPLHSTGGGSLALTNAPVVHIPLVDQAYELFPKLIPRDSRDGTGDFQADFSITKGIATVDPLKSRSESVTVTATGTVDLVKRRVSGHARANLRGLVGVATAPVSHVLTEMEISGPIDDIRVTATGPASVAKEVVAAPVKGVKGLISGLGKGVKEVFTGKDSEKDRPKDLVTGTARLSSTVLREGITLPFEALGMFTKDKSRDGSKSADE